MINKQESAKFQFLLRKSVFESGLIHVWILKASVLSVKRDLMSILIKGLLGLRTAARVTLNTWCTNLLEAEHQHEGRRSQLNNQG
jgi:hypothetical protein